ncbi:MAG: hypothetical protein P1U82_25235 [Verrucomicrobiales bacterium]|nr:hypothetical protein [Verrucomicrobiales bacterium]MDB4772503.1 hypothetical protein [Verrucomicrobiales bacterium]MDF1789189.1 hypothetical protein [Verrucomicrobiales bacterium]
MFELALQGQHTSTIATVAEAGDSQVDFGWLALARRQGNTALVSQWLLKDWARFDWLHSPQTGEQPYFQQGDDASIPELKDHPDHVTFADALLLALPDPKEDAESTRAKRLIHFAKRIIDFPWQDPALEQATLALVGLEPSAARHLKRQYQHIGKSLKLPDLHGLTYVRDRRCQQSLFQLTGRLSLADGPITLRAQLESLLSISISNGSTQPQLQELILKNLENAFLSDWHLWMPEVFTANLQLLPLASDFDAGTWLTLGWSMRLLAKDELNLVIPAQIRRAKLAPDTNASPKASFLKEVLTYLAQAMDKGELDKEARTEVSMQISQSPNFMRTLTAIPELEQA